MQPPESKVSTVGEESVKIYISAAVIKVLELWDTSRAKIHAPQPFNFANGSIDSISLISASNAFRIAREKGEILIIHQPEGIPEDQLYLVGYQEIYGEGRGEILIAMFPSDFLKRCKDQRKESFEVVEQCLKDLVLADIEAASLGKKRAAFKGDLAMVIK